MIEKSWTVADILRSSSDYLTEKGIESPRLNAELMLGKILALPRIELYMRYDRPLDAREIEQMREMLKRRTRHEPLQYILGTVEFAGAAISVESGILIPRPETEELVEKILAVLEPQSEAPLRILDIGSGTGCIAIALALHLRNARVDAVDCDFEAVRLTLQNAELNHVHTRVRSILADVLANRFFQKIDPPYDVVVSNPPYVAERDYESLAPEIRDHEPKKALTAGEDGLLFYRRLAELIPLLLRPGGIFALEMGFGQSEAVLALMCNAASIGISTDMSGIPRIIMGKFGCSTIESNRDTRQLSTDFVPRENEPRDYDRAR